MITVMIICMIIVLIVLILSVVTTTKAYDFKHTIDPLEDNPHVTEEETTKTKP